MSEMFLLTMCAILGMWEKSDQIMWCMAVFSKKKITSVHIAYAVTEATLFGQWLCNFCVCFVNSPMIMKLLFDAAIKACTTNHPTFPPYLFTFYLTWFQLIIGVRFYSVAAVSLASLFLELTTSSQSLLDIVGKSPSCVAYIWTERCLPRDPIFLSIHCMGAWHFTRCLAWKIKKKRCSLSTSTSTSAYQKSDWVFVPHPPPNPIL